MPRQARDEIGLNCDGSGDALPLPLGEGWGEGLRALAGSAPPHPVCLRKPTSPRRGEVNGAAGQADSIKKHRALNHAGAASPVSSLSLVAVSYTHLRAHETRHDLVCRL